ncbi:5-methylcytosine restriction system specificity protein McrC [Streptococcus sciuri]|uniref:McrBC 5-methylcytosine restriction system component n=1 Tax=Streptococcus sciuri TaxID=2973939 RepID=A0ABT2F534_9STRE|nr:hypothetical protein [Streptococcus sciuri]MCS4487583.1 hypothetical protein [Streptococcus sciuri]
MKTLRVEDNTSWPKDKFVPVTGIVERVADKTLEQLEKEGIFVFPELVKNAEDITKDQIIIKSVDNRYKLNNVMGFLGYGDERLIIGSRFSSDKQDYFLQYMLKKVMDFPNVLDWNTNATQENHLFSLLLFLFPYYLKIAMRKGSIKTYICNKYNDANIKGTIDIPRHIKENTPFIGNVSYNEREFSYDNYLMELIRHTIEFIKRKSCGETLLRTVKVEIKAVVAATKEYTPQNKKKIIQINKKQPIVHAFYHEYRLLQRLCILILQYEKHQIGCGKRQVHGILFDGAWLWEEYINSVIKDYFYHPMNKSKKGAQQLFSSIKDSKNNENKMIGLVYPDFISKKVKNRIVADAKYKPIENIGNRDYLQVLAYMFRFDASKGYFVYPDKNKGSDAQLKMNQGTSYQNNVMPHEEDITVIKCGLTIPKVATSYDDFVFQITASEKELLDKLIE